MDKVDGIKELLLLAEKTTSAGLSTPTSYLVQALCEMMKELPDGVPTTQKATAQVGYDWHDVEKDGLPKLEPKAEYMYTWNSQQGRELVARRAGDGFYVIGRGLYDRDTVASGDRVIRICKTRRVD